MKYFWTIAKRNSNSDINIHFAFYSNTYLFKYLFKFYSILFLFYLFKFLIQIHNIISNS